MRFTFTCMHLADSFIQSNLQCIQVIHVLSVCVCNLKVFQFSFYSNLKNFPIFPGFGFYQGVAKLCEHPGNKQYFFTIEKMVAFLSPFGSNPVFCLITVVSYKLWIVSSRMSSVRTSASCFRDVGENLLFTLLSQTAHSGLICWSSSCFLLLFFFRFYDHNSIFLHFSIDVCE